MTAESVAEEEYIALNSVDSSLLDIISHKRQSRSRRIGYLGLQIKISYQTEVLYLILSIGMHPRVQAVQGALQSEEARLLNLYLNEPTEQSEAVPYRLIYM